MRDILQFGYTDVYGVKRIYTHVDVTGLPEHEVDQITEAIYDEMEEVLGDIAIEDEDEVEYGDPEAEYDYLQEKLQALSKQNEELKQKVAMLKQLLREEFTSGN